MFRIKFFRSTPLRLAFAYGLLFVASSLLVWIATFLLLRSELHSALDASVQETFSVVASSYATDDMEDLISTMESFAKLEGEGPRVFYLGDATGRKLAGNSIRPPVQSGFGTFSASTLGLPGTDRFRVFAGDVGGNHLVVGRNLSETDDLAQLILMSFGWATALSVLLAALAGAFLAHKAQKRMTGIAHVMDDVSHGRLASRIPVYGTGDDIDTVSEQINQAIGRLSGLVEGMRQVSADIAHDLKTPLNRLRLTLEEAIEGDALGKTVTDLLAEAEQESQQINATFDALLRISQIEAGARKARFQPVDLAKVTANVAEIYTDVADDAGKRLVLNDDNALTARIFGDAELLIQLFANLIENAINHCPAGTTISLDLAVTEETVTALVADDGPGIPADEREKVFRRLYRIDKSRQTPGNGLGLSLVRAIADLHETVVDLEDNEPGTRVRLIFRRLPVSEEEVSA